MQTTITVHGTHCPSCKALIEDICSDIPEIESSNVDHETGKTVINHNEQLDWTALKQEIESSGDYHVELSK